jgi:hypothetical protein
VLKAAARAQKRTPLLAGEPDGAEGAVGAAVRAGGDAPERVVIRHARIFRDPVRGHPLVRAADARGLRGEREGPRDGLMRDDGRVKVANQADAEHIGHALLKARFDGIAHG